LKLARVDSRARRSKSHQALKGKSSLLIKFGPSQNGEEDF